MVKIYSVNKPNWVTIDTSLGEFNVSFHRGLDGGKINAYWNEEHLEWCYFDDCNLDEADRNEIIKAAKALYCS